jgi:hypothetical protein
MSSKKIVLFLVVVFIVISLTTASELNPSKEGDDLFSVTSRGAFTEGNILINGDIQVRGNILGAGADLAENIKSSEYLEAGDVVEINPDLDVTIRKSSGAYSNLVVGVISSDPGIILGQKYEGYPLALAGRVPVKVTNENGPIKRGDILTTSSTPGYAMKCVDLDKCRSAIIGKSLQELNSKSGLVIALISLS